MAAMLREPCSVGPLHLKGFGLRINFSDEATAAARDDCVKFIVDTLKPQRLVWDGDSFATTSFTALVPLIKRQLPSVALVAYLKSEDRGRFDESWDPTGLLPAIE